MKYFEATTLIDCFIERVGKNDIDYLKSRPKDRANVISISKKLNKIVKKPQDSAGRNQELLNTVKELWHILIVAAVRHISMTKVVRGIGVLKDYFNKSADFEDVLFGIDPTYRDHTLHVLWVYLLGDYVINNEPAYEDIALDWDIILSDPNDKDAEKRKKNLEKQLNENYRDAVFCIISLCHDLAYPFERTERVNRRVEELSKFIGIRTVDKLEYSFAMEQGMLLKEALDTISLRAVILNNDGIGVVRNNPTFVDASQSLEQRKHGILASYLLYRLLDTTGEVPFDSFHMLPNKENTLRDLIIRSTILSSIASHTCDYALSLTFNRFRFLLCLFDELEEFSRFLRQGRSGGVDEICKSGMKTKKEGHFHVEYRFNKEHIADPEAFFRARAIRFCRMIEASVNSPAGIKSFKMTCVDAKRRPQKKYSLRIEPKGVFVKVPDISTEIEISPDPETELNKENIGAK